MRYRTALLFVWLRLMGCVCQESSATYTVAEYESSESGGDETVEIYFSNVEELKAELNNNPKVQEYFSKQPGNGEDFCPAAHVTTIATSPTSNPVSSTSSNHEDGTTTKPDPVTTSESTLLRLTTPSFAATTATQSTTIKPDPVSTSETTSLLLTTPSFAATTATQMPTSKKTLETSRTAKTQEETTAGCIMYNNTSTTCNITYKGKCFMLWSQGAQNVNLQKAKQYCVMLGFQLGNIYDDCLYLQIMNQLPDGSLILWTGMTIKFEKNHQVYFYSNETANFLPKWWNDDGYPIKGRGNNLQIQIKPIIKLPPPFSYSKKIINSPGDQMSANGALCEKKV